MSLFDEILQGIPVNSLLREKVTQLNADKAAAEADNASLKDDLRGAQAEITNLKKQVEKLTHKEPLDEMELEFLKAISAHDSLTVDEVAQLLKLNLQRVKYHLQKLQDIGYVRRATMYIDSPPYSLTHEGRAFLIANGLL
jgi:DNA-binding MarR family transcriptional regulator